MIVSWESVCEQSDMRALARQQLELHLGRPARAAALLVDARAPLAASHGPEHRLVAQLCELLHQARADQARAADEDDDEGEQ